MLGIEIRNARKKKGITQQELAKSIKISRNYISDIENERYLPSVKTLIKIANEVDLDLNFLKQNVGNSKHKKKKHKQG